MLQYIIMTSFDPDKKYILLFKSINDISLFKNECQCSDFYIDRDQLTLVGTFSEDQLKMAIEKYKASYTRMIDEDRIPT